MINLQLIKTFLKIRSIVLTLIVFIASTSIFAKEFQTGLNGFRLRQFRLVPKNELKTLLQKDKFEDGFEYEIYAVKPDSSVYMTFEYDKANLNVIWSIQVTGRAKGYDCKFKGLKLGMSKNEVLAILGKPSSEVDVGEYGTRWEFEGTNYTLEINRQNQLGSIKIMNISDDFYPNPDITKIPSFQQYSIIIQSENSTEISKLLAPDIEVYKNNETHSFEKTVDNEISTDESGIFRLVGVLKARLMKASPEDSSQYEENMRLIEGMNPLHVVKIKTSENYTEIVFKWMFGEYRIWEIKLD